MAKKIYVAEPKVVAGTNVNTTTLCYAVYEWTEGMPGVTHLPCADECRIEFPFGADINDIRALVITDLLENFPDISSNDIIFLGGWN